MCGIGAVITSPGALTSAFVHSLHNVLLRRGPDAIHTKTIETSGAILTLLSSVLSMRGHAVQEQPTDSGDVVLCYNGEVFGVTTAPQGTNDVFPNITPQHGDTLPLLDAIVKCAERSNGDRAEYEQSLMRMFEAVEGPYACLVYCRSLNHIFVIRDPLGRRSLMYSRDVPDTIIAISSVATTSHATYAWKEFGVEGMYVLEMDDQDNSNNGFSFRCVTWPTRKTHGHPIKMWDGGREMAMPSVPNHPTQHPSFQPNPDIDTHPLCFATQYLTALYEAVRIRTLWAPQPIGVLFSGGIDSMILAALAHWCVPDPSAPIELINVAFSDYPEQAPDRGTARLGIAELKALYPTRDYRLICVNVSQAEVDAHIDNIHRVINPSDTIMDLNIATAMWFAARGKGVWSRRNGGDSSANKRVRVAGVVQQQQQQQQQQPDDDQFTQLKAVLEEELRLGNGADGNKIRLSTLGKEYQLPYKASGYKKMTDYVTAAQRAGIVKIGSDERGKYVIALHNKDGSQDADLVQEEEEESYVARARVLLCGMGADETLGGYARYKTAFTKGGTEWLKAELSKDFERLWQRNLGRDDRVVADLGREVRAPFLDENVLAVLGHIPQTCVCDFSLATGIGEKRLLRTVGRMLGLQESTRLLKRAIQFGTRIANRKNSGQTKLVVVGESADE
eukprot:PhM_4_TR2722/c2_g1_i1/m.57762